RFAPYSFTVLHTPPPSSTLFPYTTLFRSGIRGPRREPAGAREPRHGAALRARRERRGRRRSAARSVADPPARGGGAAGRDAPPPDRKSTRLNSSHVAISYAVFCLKKKTVG